MVKVNLMRGSVGSWSRRQIPKSETKAIWYHLAVAFREYIGDDFEHAMVAQQKIQGDNFASAYIRVWESCPDRDRLLELAPEWKHEEVAGMTRIRDTILFREDRIDCSNVTHGFHYIDLSFPLAYEMLLSWMKQCGLVKDSVILTGELAQWKEPKKCLAK